MTAKPPVRIAPSPTGLLRAGDAHAAPANTQLGPEFEKPLPLFEGGATLGLANSDLHDLIDLFLGV
jgi:hypothetical protein